MDVIGMSSSTHIFPKRKESTCDRAQGLGVKVITCSNENEAIQIISIWPVHDKHFANGWRKTKNGLSITQTQKFPWVTMLTTICRFQQQEAWLWSLNNIEWLKMNYTFLSMWKRLAATFLLCQIDQWMSDKEGNGKNHIKLWSYCMIIRFLAYSGRSWHFLTLLFQAPYQNISFL